MPASRSTPQPGSRGGIKDERVPAFPAHGWQDEPWLGFHPEREEDRDRHPLKGLRRFGPLSGSLVSSMMDPIRVAIFHLAAERGLPASLVN
ncbi:MAG: hypothetical protein R3C20_15730 [Planctomycetaceae bacterium]